jgi:hypothetical protein
MRKCDNGSNKITIKMTSMYNKLWKKEDQLLLLLLLYVVSHICMKDKNYQIKKDIQTTWFHQLIVFVL